MTETEQEQKGIPGYPAPKPEDLPEDERENQPGFVEAHSKEDKSIIYGEINQPEEVETETETEDTDLDRLQRKAYAKYSRRDTFEVEMRDGTVIRYKRIGIPEMEYEELEDIWSQIASARDLDNRPINRIQILHLTRLWLDKLGDYYFLNTKTKKMMTPAERRNAKDQAYINGMLKASFMRSNYDLGPVGKN